MKFQNPPERLRGENGGMHIKGLGVRYGPNLICIRLILVQNSVFGVKLRQDSFQFLLIFSLKRHFRDIYVFFGASPLKTIFREIFGKFAARPKKISFSTLK